MAEINSTVTLRLTTIEGATPKQASSLLKRMLRESTKRQNSAIKANLTTDCTGYAKFSSSAARELELPIPRTTGRLAASRVDEMDRSEAYRILGAYQKRLALAKYLKSTKWLASFEECKADFGWVDYQLYKNLLRAGSLPKAPKIESAVIPTSKSDFQFTRLSLSGTTITLEHFALWDRWADLTFEIPEKLAALHPNLSKVTRPNIRLLNGEVVFDFVLRENVEPEIATPISTLGVDLGVEKPFSAARVYSDGRYSEEFLPSVFTERQSATAAKLSREIPLVSGKNKRRAKLGISNERAVIQERTLRDKRSRVNTAMDWSAASDILAHSKPGEQITVEQLNFNTGGSLGAKYFRPGLMIAKLEHVARRSGKNVKRVRASYSSQECPYCKSAVVPDAARMSNCACGWIADRDYTAAIVIGRRGLKAKKLSVKKTRPTPKRPRAKARVRAVLPFKNRAWTAFTGAAPAEATGTHSSSATSVIGILPLSSSSKPPTLTS